MVSSSRSTNSNVNNQLIHEKVNYRQDVLAKTNDSKPSSPNLPGRGLGQPNQFSAPEHGGQPNRLPANRPGPSAIS